MSKPDFADIRAQIAAQHAAADQLISDYRAQYGDIAIVLIHEQPEIEKRPWRGVMLAPYLGGAGVCVHYFDADGFSGFTVYKNEHEAIIDGYHDWMPDPDWLDRLALDDRFQRGNAYALALENLRCAMRGAPSDEQWQATLALRAHYYP